MTSMPRRLKEDFYRGNSWTNHDLWNKMLANHEATYAQNGCDIDKNVEVDVW